MWRRAELKARAKNNLRKYYWPALAVSLICSLVAGNKNTGSISSGANVGVNVTQNYAFNLEESLSGDFSSMAGGFSNLANGLVGSVDTATMSVILMVVLIVGAISLAMGIFVAPIIKVGKNRFYMESRVLGSSAGMDELIWGFKNHYINIVWTMFVRNLIVILGSLFCVVPGIYLAYCFYMVPYILAENPEMSTSEVLKLSKDMMAGQKLNTWVLEISFIGWWILGALAMGFGSILVQPYFDATQAELYAVLRHRFSGYLNGFGVPEPEVHDNWKQSSQETYQQSYHQPYQDIYQQSYQQAAESQETNEQNVNKSETVRPIERETEVKRSEGGPGRGYYLNGVFYPYTEDELRELEENQHKN